MKFVVTGGSILVLAAAITQHSLTASQQPQFGSGTRTVAVYATVTDKGGRLVPDLGPDAFEVRDNGKPQPITVFSNDVQPITVVMMLDRSGSMRGNVGLVEQAAGEFVRRLDPKDRARIGIFAERIDIQPEGFISDQQELMRVLRSNLPVTGPTPLWNAVDEAIDALKSQDGRKVVLVFSDGADAPMNFRLDNRSVMDVMRRAQQEDVMVYAIGLQSAPVRGGPGGGMGGFGGMAPQRPDPALATVAQDTGGGYFELTRADDLRSAFARVADELHRQYALGFEPPKLDDKMHKIEVRVTTQGMKARARKEYFARRSPASSEESRLPPS